MIENQRMTSWALAAEGALMMRSRLWTLVAAFGILVGQPPPTFAATSATGDPLTGILRRLDRYLEHNEVDGVTMDWRYSVIPSEEIRQTVVCQVLGEAELYRAHPTRRRRAQIARHADYLLAHLDSIRSGSPFDGMLALSLLAAWEVTGDPRHREAAATMVRELKAIPTSQCILNGGLMVAIAMAAERRLTGDEDAGHKADLILAQLPPYQNADGSFPHWCPGSEDIHYTGWMGLELVQFERWSGDFSPEPTLARMSAFLESRGDPRDTTHYQAPCGPGCVRYFYSRASGCGIDYDTRGWTVEPAYSAVLFDHFHSTSYLPAMRFLDSLETRGTISDLWGYWPPPNDPEYPWTIADTSVVNMSIIYWTLATIFTGRPDARALAGAVAGDDETPVIVGTDPVHPDRVRLARVTDVAGIGLELDLPRPSDVEVDVYDLAGRRVRELFRGRLTAGIHAFTWDGHRGDGSALPNGVYYARAKTGDGSSSLPMTLLH